MIERCKRKRGKIYRNAISQTGIDAVNNKIEPWDVRASPDLTPMEFLLLKTHTQRSVVLR
jgi:hypothetical protein